MIQSERAPIGLSKHYTNSPQRPTQFYQSPVPYFTGYFDQTLQTELSLLHLICEYFSCVHFFVNKSVADKCINTSVYETCVNTSVYETCVNISVH